MQPTMSESMRPTMSDRPDSSGLVIRIMLVALFALGVIGILMVAPAEAATTLG